MTLSCKTRALFTLAFALAAGLCSAEIACDASGKCALDVYATTEKPVAVWGYLEYGGCPKSFTNSGPNSDDTRGTRTFQMGTQECTVEYSPELTVLYCGKKGEDPIKRTWVDMRVPAQQCPETCTCTGPDGLDWKNVTIPYKFEWQVDPSTGTGVTGLAATGTPTNEAPPTLTTATTDTTSTTTSPTTSATTATTATGPGAAVRRHLNARTRLPKH